MLTNHVDSRSVQCCNVLNDVFFERSGNITQSTIYLSLLNARSFPTPGWIRVQASAISDFLILFCYLDATVVIINVFCLLNAALYFLYVWYYNHIAESYVFKLF